MKVQSVDNVLVPLRQMVKTRVLPERRDAGLDEIKAQTADQADQAEEKGKDNPDRGILEEAVEKANKTMETYGTELRFSIHEASGEIMVKVINTRDNTVIREIPPERILDFVAHVKKMLGIIIDKFI